MDETKSKTQPDHENEQRTQRTQSISKMLLDCATAFYKLIGTKYHIVLGKSGKSISFDLTFSRYDCHHLMGIHYLTDRPDRRSRARIFDDILNSDTYRQHLATSDFWNEKILNRVACTTILEQLIDDNRTVFHFNPRRTRFFSEIKAEYLMANSEVILSSASNPQSSSIILSVENNELGRSDSPEISADSESANKSDSATTELIESEPAETHDVYIFIDKRSDSDERYCKSIFPKTNLDYTEGQAVWTLLYKEKITGNSSVVLYHHKGYVVP